MNKIDYNDFDRLNTDLRCMREDRIAIATEPQDHSRHKWLGYFRYSIENRSNVHVAKSLSNIFLCISE